MSTDLSPLAARAWVRADDVAAPARRWFEHTAAALPAGLWEAALARRVLSDAPGVGPLTAEAFGLVHREDGTHDITPSERSLSRAWASFGGAVDEVHAGAYLRMTGGQEVGAADFGVTVDPAAPGWTALAVSLPLDSFLDETWLRETLLAFVTATPVDFAVITRSYGLGLEDQQPVPRGPATLAGRDVLRSYEWVTVLAEPLAGELGGVDGLRRTGAFSEVRAVAGGSVWAQATDSFDDYTPARVEAVFSALRPVLPARRLDKPELNPSPWVIWDGTGERPDPSPPQPARNLSEEELLHIMRQLPK